MEAAFGRAEHPDEEAYEALVVYFLKGFETYRRDDGSGALYPGLPSSHGDAVDAMEGFSRLAPLIGAWIHSGRRTQVDVGNGEIIDLADLLRRGIVAGTNPDSPGFWGEIEDFDQRLCEAADIALTLWLTREVVWARLPHDQQRRVAGWLRRGAVREVTDNNWHLFIVLIATVLRDMAPPAPMQLASSHYARFKEFYRGEGWFSDGPNQVFDFYNVWGIHYALSWIDRIDPSWDPVFIRKAQESFLSTYKYFIARDGVPILGRSVCYRGAVAAPLVLGAASGSSSVSVGEARRALDVTWRAYIGKGMLQNGAVSQGYCGPDARVLDNYSGPASCLWSLRSLVAAFAQADKSPFWLAEPQSLPIDEAGFTISIAPTGWLVSGDQETGAVTITMRDGLPPEEAPLKGESPLDRLKTLALGRPHRSPNLLAKYRRSVYSSSRPFTECVVPQ